MDDMVPCNTDNSSQSSDQLKMLQESLDDLLAVARPQLARFALTQGVAQDAIDDVVQETLIEAWSHLDHLRAPDRFHAWLSGICRNVCLRWKRAHKITSLRQESLSSTPLEESGAIDARLSTAFSSSFTLDPAEELDRQDLAALLDRAMTYLSDDARTALKMHYLTELPKYETAMRLGLTIKALEVRLHRARLQLRQVLRNELHDDAIQFGLASSIEMSARWRQTRIWCYACGRQRLLGMFEQLPQGRVNLRMRCPVCSSPDDFDIVSTWGMVPLDNLRSFRPALKRVIQGMKPFFLEGIANGYQKCPLCMAIAKVRGIEPCMLPFPFLRRLCFILDCPGCGVLVSMVTSASLSYPIVQQFLAQHACQTLEPETFVEYAGHSTIRIRFVDIASSARLNVFLLSNTLQLLGFEQE
ncbi:MAG TPA: RNA polymerase sigma factor [Ktedonobacteraceae bacterium]|nr:RNA polymerase sigma factor [Ktedonobacteraceae bacterium]